MFQIPPDRQMKIYSKKNGSFFILVRNLLSREVSIIDKGTRIYFLDNDSEDSLSEMSLPLKGNEWKFLKLFQENAPGIYCANVTISGVLSLLDEEIVFMANWIRIEAPREKIQEVFGGAIRLKDPNEPPPKRHSND